MKMLNLTKFCPRSLQLKVLNSTLQRQEAAMNRPRTCHQIDFELLWLKREVKAVQKAAVPQNMQKSTSWSVSVWKEWSKSRWTRFSTLPSECVYILASSPDHFDHWLTRFVLEASCKDGQLYPPNTLHQLICGILCYVRSGALRHGTSTLVLSACIS